MPARVIAMVKPDSEPAKLWESRFWRQAKATHKLAIREEMTRARARAFAEMIAEHSLRNGDTFIGRAAADFIEQMERGG